MDEANFSANCPSADKKQQENIKNEIVLKDSNNVALKTRVEKVPAKVNATRLMGSPPFSKEVYNLFISSLKYGEPAYPTTKELKEIDFYSSKGTTHRKRFRKLLARFEHHVVQGSLLLSANLEEDVLVHKRTGKILVPKEDVDKIIRRAHLYGSNEVNESAMAGRICLHYNVTRTLTVLEKDFTVKQREFGIGRHLVESVVFRCPSCKKGHLTFKDRIKFEQFTNKDETTSLTEKKCQSKTIGSSQQMFTQTFGDINQLEKARFPSMVAHTPDKTCIWYDRKSIAEATNKFDKLMMVISEMRGEASLAVKGDLQAKQRFEAKLYCGQLLIKDQAKSIQKLLILEESPEVFRIELTDLEQEYRLTGQADTFSSDIEDLLTHVRMQKLVLSPLIVKEIEDFVTLQSDMITDSMEV